MIDAVLFDVGNTLLHSQVSKPAAALELGLRPVYDRLIELDFKLPEFADYFRIVKRRFSWAYIWSRIVRREVAIVNGIQRIHRRLGINLSVEQTGNLYRKSISAVSAIFTIDEHAREVVTKLHQAGLKLGLVSNTVMPGFTIDEFLEDAGFLDYFPVRIYSSDVRYMKPSRKIFRLALDQLDVAAERTIFVGDRVDNDVVGASRLGMKTVLFIPGDKYPREWDCADHTIRRLTEIPAIVGDRNV
ncbi:MAG: HAD family hydrolase [Planctomycetota bacterium]|jgi:HAD superfamily hydrolase (TIGR01549 family)